jgi:hypothetical protein
MEAFYEKVCGKHFADGNVHVDGPFPGLGAG